MIVKPVRPWQLKLPLLSHHPNPNHSRNGASNLNRKIGTSNLNHSKVQGNPQDLNFSRHNQAGWNPSNPGPPKATITTAPHAGASHSKKQMAITKERAPCRATLFVI